MNLETIPGQLDDIRDSIRRGDVLREQFAQQINSLSARFDANDYRLRVLETGVAENTVLTRDMSETVSDIKAIVEAGRAVTLVGRGATRIVKWIGALAIAGSAIYAVVYQLTHNGKLP